MGASGQYFGGTRRFYYSTRKESAWGTAQTLARVLNPIDGSELLGPVQKDILSNAGAAQGQSELETLQYPGAEITKAAPTFYLNPESIGRFASSLFGNDTKTTWDTTMAKHLMEWHNAPVSFTVEEHCQGSADCTLAWGFAGTWCSGLKIIHKAGQQFCTIQPRLVLSKYVAPAAQAAIDVIANWPGAGTVVGVPPTAVSIWCAATTGNTHTSPWSGSFVGPATPGTPWEDLTSQIALSPYASSWELDIESGVDDADRFRGGVYSGAGFVGGSVVSSKRSATLSIDLDSASISDNFVTWYNDISSTVQKSWTFQMTGVSEYVPASLPTAFSIVVPAMVPSGIIKDSTGLGPRTRKATFRMVQSGNYVYPITIATWDQVTQDYDSAS